MIKTIVTDCDNCPMWQYDRDTCMHPNCEVKDTMTTFKRHYFEQCPLKNEPITISLDQNTESCQ
jgi:hypothetical protein